MGTSCARTQPVSGTQGAATHPSIEEGSKGGRLGAREAPLKT